MFKWANIGYSKHQISYHSWDSGMTTSQRWVWHIWVVISHLHVGKTLQLRHKERNGVSNHLRLVCLLNCWSRRRSNKTSKLRVTGLRAGNSPVTGEFPAQKTSNAEDVSVWWRHHEYNVFVYDCHAVYDREYFSLFVPLLSHFWLIHLLAYTCFLPTIFELCEATCVQSQQQL